MLPKGQKKGYFCAFDLVLYMCVGCNHETWS